MDFQDSILISTATLGLIIFTVKFINILILTYNFFIRPQKNFKSTYGSWALITGSTDGIGKSIAFHLFSQGINLILVGRNVEKLETTVNEIKHKQLDHQVEVKTIVIDFAKDEQSKVTRAIEEGISGLDVGILINNVGLCYPYAKFFHEVDFDMMESIVKVNVEGTSVVTKTVLNNVMMMRKRGVVVNIGSGSSGPVSSYPLFAIYSATKAYIAQFSRSIGVEYKQYGIDVQCQIPLLVATKMASIRKSSLFIPSAETFSKASLRWIGYDAVCVPYWPHYLQCCMCSVLPDSLLDWCLFRYFLGMRKRGLKKDSVKTKTKPKNV